MSDPADKPALRREFLARLAALTPEEKSAASADIRARLLEWPVFRAARTVLLFHPLSAEPDLLPLLAHPACAGKTFVFPLTHRETKTLTLHAAADTAEFLTKGLRLREPDPARHPEIPPALVDLVLVPGLAFAEDGSRLGRGGGYYDRFLPGLPPAAVVAGVFFPCQLRAPLPREPHDVPLGALVTAYRPAACMEVSP